MSSVSQKLHSLRRWVRQAHQSNGGWSGAVRHYRGRLQLLGWSGIARKLGNAVVGTEVTLDPIQIFAPVSAAADAQSVALVFHDLSNSGAPRALFELAKYLTERGSRVVCLSPMDGPYRAELQALGATVVVDPLVLSGHASSMRLIHGFDLVVANTMLSWRVVQAVRTDQRTIWFVHEADYIRDAVQREPMLAQVLRTSAEIWVPSHRSATVMADFASNVRVVECGTAPIHGRALALSGPIKLGIYGTLEPRKGQDLAIEAFKALPEDIGKLCELHIVGRVQEESFRQELLALAGDDERIRFGGEVTSEQCRRLIADSDILLCASRDEPLSLVTLDALAAGRILLCSAKVGASKYLTDGVDSFIAPDATAPDFERLILDAIAQRPSWPQIGAAAAELHRQNFSTEALHRRFDAIAALRPASARGGQG